MFAAPDDRGVRRLLPQWAMSNTIAAAALIGAGTVAFFSTWFLLSPFAGSVDRSFLIGMIVGNVVIAAGFAILIGVRLWHVISGRRHQIAGSRTQLQLVGIFSLIAAFPAVVAFLFAFTILRAGLNDVFSERIDNYQNTARDLARGLIEFNRLEAEQTIREIAFDIRRQEEARIGLEQTPISFRQYMFTQAGVRGLAALYLLDGDMNMLVSAELVSDSYNLPSGNILDALHEDAAPGAQFVFGVNDDESYDYFRGALSIEDYGQGYLIAYFPIDAQTSARIAAAREVVADWEDAKAARSRLERVFLAGYIILAIIILFGAIWLSLWAATRLVQPIGRLVHMAKRVSGGALDARVEVYKDDGELGVLARAMNHMTAQLHTQRNDLIDTNRQFDRRRRFTEAVLSGVSAGVIGLAENGRITIANKSAADLLENPSTRLTGANIKDIMPELMPVLERAAHSAEREVGDQLDLTRQGQRRTVNVRIVKDEVEGEQSYVATFDDITQLIAAQRNAAWGDVARRIAHEIKNPLTPIQLSAERLRRKYINEIKTSPEVFDRCIETIVRQVSDIGRMTDEFSSFARMPKPVINVEDLRELIKAAVFPQKVAFPEIDFVVETPDAPVLAECDGRLIVQALSNLLKNAGESIGARLADADGEGAHAGVIKVRLDRSAMSAAIHIVDNGLGLPIEERHRLAEPYITTRSKGTGLGLAIVKKIAEEHGGGLSFVDDDALGVTGARMTLRLPLVEETHVSKDVQPATAAE